MALHLNHLLSALFSLLEEILFWLKLKSEVLIQNLMKTNIVEHGEIQIETFNEKSFNLKLFLMREITCSASDSKKIPPVEPRALSKVIFRRLSVILPHSVPSCDGYHL